MCRLFQVLSKVLNGLSQCISPQSTFGSINIEYYQETHPQSGVNSMFSTGNNRVIRVADKEKEGRDSVVISKKM